MEATASAISREATAERQKAANSSEKDLEACCRIRIGRSDSFRRNTRIREHFLSV
jgi:hypothetical protein